MKNIKVNIIVVSSFLFAMLAYPFIWTALDSELDSAASRFKSLGIIRGYSNGSIGENNTVTRGELLRMLDRYDKISKKSNQENLLGEPILCTGNITQWLRLYTQDQKGNSLTGVVIVTEKIQNGWSSEKQTYRTMYDDGGYSLLPEMTGNFLVTVTKEWYSEHRETVYIPALKECHVDTQVRTITLIKKE